MFGGLHREFLLKFKRSVESDRAALPWVCLALMIILLPTVTASLWPGWNVAPLLDFLHLAALLLLPALLFRVPLRLIFLLVWPAVCVAPVAVVCQLTTHFPPSEWFFLVLLESNSAEASVFGLQLAGFFSLTILLAIAYHWILKRRIAPAFRAGPLFGLFVLVCGVMIPASDMAKLGATWGWDAEVSRLKENFPVQTFAAGYNAALLRHQITHRKGSVDPLAVKATGPELAAGQREIHVLVLGETARYSCFGVNGYGRDTTPLLGKVEGLLSFKDVTAPAPATSVSVPVLLTPSTAVTAKQASSQPSLLNVFRLAGFKVHWLSTQPKHGVFDTTCSTFAQDADEARFFSHKLAIKGEAFQTVRDSELIPAVRQVIEGGEKKLFIVLHTMGSHAVYTDRYPAEYERFPSDPSICAAARNQVISGDFTEEQNRHLQNGYDNSILYTDWVLHSLIEVLNSAHAVSSFYYVSDHGENGADAPMMAFGHGTFTSDVLRIPLMVWLSPEYQKARGRQTQALRSHLSTPFSADTTFHTVCDLGGISCVQARPDYSVASESFRAAPRMVASLNGEVVDYDKQIVPQEAKRKGWNPAALRASR